MQLDSLARFGMEQDPAAIEQIQRHAGFANESVDAFVERAGAELDVFTPIIVHEVLPRLEEFDATWHQEGFMVFTLGASPYGSLRLHVWPAGLRKASPAQRLEHATNGMPGAGIHDHSWVVVGEVLTGYEDVLYKASADPTDFTEKELNLGSVYKYYMAVYQAANTQGLHALQDNYMFGYESVPPEGLDAFNNFLLLWAAPDSGKPNPFRTFIQGDLHIIAPREWHKPMIPEDKVAATAVRISRRYYPDGPFVLLDKTAPQIIPNKPREVVTLEDKLLAKEQLLDALAPKANLWTPRSSGIVAVHATMDELTS